MRLSWAMPIMLLVAHGVILGVNSETKEVVAKKKLSDGVHRRRPGERYRRKPHIHLFHLNKSHEHEKNESEVEPKHDLAHDLVRLGQDLLFLGSGHHPGHVIEDLLHIGQDIVKSDLTHDIVNLGQDLFFLGPGHHPGHVFEDMRNIGHDLLHIGEQGPGLLKVKAGTKHVTSISSSSALESLNTAGPTDSQSKATENVYQDPVTTNSSLEVPIEVLTTTVSSKLNSLEVIGEDLTTPRVIDLSKPEPLFETQSQSTLSPSQLLSQEIIPSISASEVLENSNFTEPLFNAVEQVTGLIDVTEFTTLPEQSENEETILNDLKPIKVSIESELDKITSIISDETFEHALSSLKSLSFSSYIASNRQRSLENELTTLNAQLNSLTNSLTDLFAHASKTKLTIYVPIIAKFYTMWQTCATSIDRALLFAKLPRDILSSMRVLSPTDLNSISLNQKMSHFQLGRATGQIQALNEAINKLSAEIAPESVGRELIKHGFLTLPDLAVPFLTQRPPIPVLELKSTLVQPDILSSLKKTDQ